ncbi:MAG: ABC transporter substrate-binding protein [Dehalococcoidia bacterium]
MAELNYWERRRPGRRGLLRSAGIGLAGLGGAALIGCGDGDDSSDASGGSGGDTSSSGSSSAAASSGSDWYKGERAPGFDPALGVVPINEKARVAGGTFTRPDTDTTRQQDPDVSIARSDHEIINDRLVYANGWTMELMPDLLESWEVADDGLSIVLNMREGIKTHNIAPTNGRPFTAEDVAYSIERKAGILDPVAAEKYARAGQFIGLERAEVVDDVTVKLVLSRPNSAIMAAFADPRAQMMPREQDDIGYTDPLKFVGTGPWIQTEFVEGTRQVFTANPDYYRTAEEGGRPSFEKFEKIVMSDRAAQVAAFISGQIGVLATIQPHEEPQVRAAVGDAQWFGQPNFGWNHFAVNTKLPFFADDRVRQALQLSMDYAALADPWGPGWLYSGPLHVMFAEAYSSDEIKAKPGYNPDTKEQDIAEAVKRMAAAGYPEGEGISFKDTTSQASGLSFDAAIRQKEHWAQVFPKMAMEISPVTDYASFTNLLNSREFEARTYHHTMVPNAVADARTYYHSQGGRNYQSFERPWADEILDKVLEENDLEARTALFHEFEDRYIEEGPPLLQLLVSRDNHAFQSNVAGMDLVTGTWAYGLTTYGVGPRWYWQTE